MFDWLFGRKSQPEPPRDLRDWNEDWKVGDIAECIIDGVRIGWHPSIKPWNRLAYRSRWEVVGFGEGLGVDGAVYYFLYLKDAPNTGGYPTNGFRKVRPIARREESVVERILNAPAGPDVVREPVDG